VHVSFPFPHLVLVLARPTPPRPLRLAFTGGCQLGRGKEAAPFVALLAAMQYPDGSVPGSDTSITSSTGAGLLVETTAVAVLAWLHDESYGGHTQKAMKWLVRP
jgi:hypothetical protein